MGGAMGGTAIAHRGSRRFLILIALCVFLIVSFVVVLKVVYPRVAESKIRSKLTAKIEQRLGMTPTIGSIEVKLGLATVRNLMVGERTSEGKPLVTIDKIEIAYDGNQSLLGRVKLADVKIVGVHVHAERKEDGGDNFARIVAQLRSTQSGGTGQSSGDSMRPTGISVSGISVDALDQTTGAYASITDGDASWSPTEIRGMLRGVEATAPTGQTLSATQVAVQKLPASQPSMQIAGGIATVGPTMSLTGIAGTIAGDDAAASRLRIDLSGGYGGVDAQLWTARGWLDPKQMTAIVDVDAAKFHLDRLSPILANAQLVDYQKTTVDANLHMELNRDGGTFAGTFHLADLTVGHPMLADREVHGLGLEGNIAGSISRSQRRLEITKGDFVSRGLPMKFTGSVALAGGMLPDGTRRAARVASAHFLVPPVDCQAALKAIPKEMATYMAGYDLKGTFATDIRLAIDWNDLDATQLEGSVGIRNCKVIDRPSDSPERLKEDFEHYVEVDKGEWISFEVGPDNDDFVPLQDISPYLIKSIMSTEDSAFRSHHGFIPSEFRTALVNNLKAGAFKYGASSITMQLVKNALLYRKKTLARKLQELFLTWDVENVLSKDRIMEVYLNVIEYGPGLYGIGPAAAHYFDKAAKDLTPVEAAFFSSILPSPKLRYKQYCAGTLSKWTEAKISKILAIMHKRGRLDQAEYDTAIATPLLFAKDGSETEAECLQRQKRAVKNARSTNPQEK
jgi:hypothetical protein